MTTKLKRKQYSPEFKSEALKLAAKTSVASAAKTDQVFAFIVWGMLFAPLPLFSLAAISNGSSGFIQLMDTLDGAALFSILFQAYPTTLLGYWIWNRLIVKSPCRLPRR
jgi:O-acetylserine/cysteine efflux transporter